MLIKKQLSQRLLVNASLVPFGSKVADIGCDHGLVSIYLCEKGIAQRVIAMDVNEGPLERARKHVEEAKVSTEVECRKSDGLENLQAGEADTILIGGMGGSLVVSILSAKPELLKQIQHLILQPQSELSKVRHFLHDHRFRIIEEQMVFEEGKYYTSIHAVQGEQYFEKEIEYVYGRDLFIKKDEVFRSYLMHEHKKHQKILQQLDFGRGERIAERRREVSKTLKSLEGLLELLNTGKERI